MDVPTRGSSTDSDTLHVEWEAVEDDEAMGGSEIIYYSVYKESSADSIYQTSGTSFLYEQQAGDAAAISFRVAASNIYGTGDISDLSEAIAFGSVPDKLENLKSENVDSENLQATITWDEPDPTITGWEFEILNKDTNTYTNADSIMGDDTNLADNWGRQFDSSELIANFGYQAGDRVAFRVRVSNTVGNSEWAYPAISDMGALTLTMLI